MVGKVGNNDRSLGSNPGASFVVGSSIQYLDPLSGKAYPSWMVAAVDQLLAKIKHMDIWQTVDFILEIWAKRYPEDHRLFLEDMKRYRANRANKHASTQSRSLRELVIIPPLVNYLLNKLAWDKIESYGEDKFKRDFSKRYSGFRPGERY
jgi:hypothetical protein